MRRLLALLILACAAVRADTVLPLPFFNHTRSSSLDWIGESIAETVREMVKKR